MIAGSGWGACFIQHLAAGAHGINDGVRGTTTATYRARGNWDSLLKQVKDAQGSCMPFVTISFGHNDEKALSEEQYRANLGRMFDDASAAGAKVLFVSPLSRRVFSNGRVVRDLARWADDMASVASQKGATCLNLNQASADLLDQEGASVAASYNLAAGDYTHLNAAGCQVFGQLVAQLAHDHVPDLAALVKP